MKKLITLTLIALLTVSMVPQTKADGGRHTAAGVGFLAGALATSFVMGHEHPVRYEHPVYVERYERPSGHWETQYQQIWIPGRQIIIPTPNGDMVQYEQGHYEYRQVMVWVRDYYYGR